MNTDPDPPATKENQPASSWAQKRDRVRLRRNKGYDETHSSIISATVQLIAEKGVEALSVSGVARALGMDRKTLYYHFAGRDALLKAALQWSSQQLVRSALPIGPPRAERTAHISRFVLENPELIKLWIDEFISPGDIRDRYTQWDALVEQIGASLIHHEEPIDVEVYCALMLTAAFIAPRVYHHSIRPDLPLEEIVRRFCREQTRMLDADARFPPD